jgi:hypothetical protein
MVASAWAGVPAVKHHYAIGQIVNSSSLDCLDLGGCWGAQFRQSTDENPTSAFIRDRGRVYTPKKGNRCTLPVTLGPSPFQNLPVMI